MLGLGPCVRRIAPPAAGATAPALYLSFDDGPDPEGTPATLDVLERLGAKATFFVVARSAQRRPDLLRRIVDAGHAVGNHSLDHTWGPFFAPRRRLLEWVRTSEAILRDLTGQDTVGFRSPAGVRTPPLAWALAELDIPLVHWSVRFYDAVRRWDETAALRSLGATPPGSIVLLHDKQKPELRETYLKTLERYMEAANDAGFELLSLRREECAAQQSSRRALAQG